MNTLTSHYVTFIRYLSHAFNRKLGSSSFLVYYTGNYKLIITIYLIKHYSKKRYCRTINKQIMCALIQNNEYMLLLYRDDCVMN